MAYTKIPYCKIYGVVFNLYTNICIEFYTWLKYLFSSIQTLKITENMRFFVIFCPIQLNIF